MKGTQTSRVRLVIVGIFIGPFLSPVFAQEAAVVDSIPTSEQLEAAHARIGEVRIVNGNVFATETREENNSFFRLANRLHIKTRENTIRLQLLFKAGDPYSDRLLRESERILRSNRYLFDAEIVPVAYHDGIVDVEVRTRDVWTFKPGINYGRSGGTNTTGIELQESNLLGYGKEVTIAHRTDVDRTTNELDYIDSQLFDTHGRVQLSYDSNSDGRQRNVILDRPFYSLDTRWSASLNALDWQRTDQRYVLGNVADEFRHDQQRVELSGGISPGWESGWIKRLTFGAVYSGDRFGPTTSVLSATMLPDDRRFVYPYIGFALFQDDFERRRNEDQIERTEDLYTGSLVQASVGWASTSFGSLRNAAVLNLTAGTSFESEQKRHTVVLQCTASSRIESDGLENAMFNGSARYYWRVAERQLFYAALSGTATHNLDADRQLTLGGDTGLRGYPLRYQQGSSAALFTIEHRIYTKYYLFRLFNVGGAVFFDAGRTWGEGTAPVPATVNANLGLLKDAGFGLRFGSSRSAFGNVVHVDLAFPLDGDNSIKRTQFIVETKASF
jgi:hemolysin activation/secretion protein